MYDMKMYPKFACFESDPGKNTFSEKTLRAQHPYSTKLASQKYCLSHCLTYHLSAIRISAVAHVRIHKKKSKLKIFWSEKKCPHRGTNTGPSFFQSDALPRELWGLDDEGI